MNQRIRSNELPERISHRILQEIAVGTMEAGQHVSAQQVADRYRVSRTPVREALSSLEKCGVLKRKTNRGYFVPAEIPNGLNELIEEYRQSPADPYQQLANDWVANRLPGEVTEQHLRQNYGWSKSKVVELLARATREGWAERKDGYGWRFLPVAKTSQAFEQIYRLRLAIEPAALLEPTFQLDRKVLDEQRRIQSGMLEKGADTVAEELQLSNGSLFHEEIIKLSGNQFFLQALTQVNRMRRLMEYKVKVDPIRTAEQCTEHLEIIDLLESGDIVEASYKMRSHLAWALKIKTSTTLD